MVAPASDALNAVQARLGVATCPADARDADGARRILTKVRPTVLAIGDDDVIPTDFDAFIGA